MKVRILTDISDLSGEHKAGDEPDLLDDRAAEYIKAGIAEELSATPVRREAPAPEAAMLGDAPEHATMPRARARGV